ncbi:2'-5' RNA ligase [Planctomicrobium piriforme]|uniref:RNA 2',3'-cyclic phosphodiesterase n=2 Tax=Planctomicrobium piriforme TaxID=1576369 RepID=A0A1I3PGQ7_9PLAN|nr:2'-5' RNA ligase [Planctomicrobium piriforme]
MQPRGLEGARLADPDSFHLTLHFLGSLSSEQISEVIAALNDVAFATFPLTIRGANVFRRDGVPFVLWAGVDDCPALRDLQREIGTALHSASGFQPENRTYSPHITLARLKENVLDSELSAELRRNAEVVIAEIAISQFALFSSRNENGVPYYRVEAQFSNDART